MSSRRCSSRCGTELEVYKSHILSLSAQMAHILPLNMQSVVRGWGVSTSKYCLSITTAIHAICTNPSKYLFNRWRLSTWICHQTFLLGQHLSVPRSNWFAKTYNGPMHVMGDAWTPLRCPRLKSETKPNMWGHSGVLSGQREFILSCWLSNRRPSDQTDWWFN